MKKLFLTSCLLTIIACPSFANIDKDASTATCDNTTIGTTTGPANLQADWTANTINLDFYSEGEKVGTGQCTYDGAITLPNTPEVPTGYTFGGWRLRAAAAPAQQTTFDLSTLAEYINTETTATGYVLFDGETGFNETTYGLTTPGEWATEFSYGTVKGIARCSTQHPITPWYNNNNTFASDNFASSLTDETGQEGSRYCWCQPTGFDAEKDGTYVPVSQSSWVFDHDLNSANSCARCVNVCIYDMVNSSAFRAALYGINQ